MNIPNGILPPGGIKPPPILRDLFPNTAGSIKLTPQQAMAWMELFVRHINSSERLPLKATVRERSPFKLTIEVEALMPTLTDTTPETP